MIEAVFHTHSNRNKEGKFSFFLFIVYLLNVRCHMDTRNERHPTGRSALD
jgi:hypothetical protein